MHFISLDINRAERSGRAEVLASTTTDTFVFIHGGHFHRAVRAFVVNHLYGSHRAVAGAVAATYAIGQNHAVFLHPHGMTSMNGGLFLSRNGLDGTSGTDFAATCTFGSAVATLKRHYGLHEVLQVGRRPQHIVRAARHAKLAGCAMPLQMSDADGSGRRDDGVALGGFLVLDDCQTAIHFHLGLGQGRCGASHSCTNEESAALRVDGLRRCNGFLGGVMQRIKLALVKAIAANHAARVVYRTVLEINGLCLAVFFAHATTLALVLVETHTQQREAREETQCRSHGANRVAIEAAFAQGKEA